MSISADTLHVARLDTDAVTINSSYPSITLFFFLQSLWMTFASTQSRPSKPIQKTSHHFLKIRHLSAVKSYLTPDHPYVCRLSILCRHSLGHSSEHQLIKETKKPLTPSLITKYFKIY